MNCMGFEITSPNTIHCGQGAISKVAAKIAELGSISVITTGVHLHKSNLTLSIIDELEKLGVDCVESFTVAEEPTVEMVDELAGVYRDIGADVVLSIGGGSVIDCVKAAAMVAVNKGNAEDYQLKRREIENHPIPHIAIPTTAGTGSEATRVSVLSNNSAGVKRSISHPLMTPNAVILDPELTVTLPLYLTTLTAMDALSHAIESAVSSQSNAFTKHIAFAAIEQTSLGLPNCQSNPYDLDARTKCLIGSCFAGWSMQAGLGASHSLAPAVCIAAGCRHSEAIAALLPNAIRLNERAIPGVYAEVARIMNCSNVALRIEELCISGGFDCKLAKFGLKSDDWPEVLEIMKRYASHRKTNPVEVTDDYARELFEMSL